MAIQSPFFNKRDNEPTANRTPAAGAYPSAGAGYSSPQPATAGTPAPGVGSASNASGVPGTQPKESASKLTVGPNIKLKGVEITDCDTLVVEGTVEATMDSRLMQIAEQGAFKGSAEIDIAEIHGSFDGNLTVRQRLVIHSTGRVTGKIRYGKIVIEEGGQLSGEIQFGTVAPSTAAGGSKAPQNRPDLQIIG